MTNKLNTKNMVITALLIALGIIIPTAFGFLRVNLPFFTATITAHVPIFVAMFISPASAIFTAIGTTIGFLLTGTPLLVTARAASHIVFAIVGALMVSKKMSIVYVGIVTAILHAVFEIIVAYIFFIFGLANPGASLVSYIFITIGVGTLIHHIVDYIIAIVLIKALAKTKAIKDIPSLV